MTSLHVTYFFATSESASAMAAHCDALMERLLEREAEDPRVTDSTVSMSAEVGIVEVEAFADADTREEAETLITERIASVVDEVVGLSNTVERERRIELVS